MVIHLRAVLLEVGEAGKLSAKLAEEAGRWVRAALASDPAATVEMTLGGFDADPRAVWEIPEARTYFAGVLRGAGITDWRDPLVLRFGEPTLAALARCDVFAADHPFLVVMRTREERLNETLEDVERRKSQRDQAVREAVDAEQSKARH